MASSLFQVYVCLFLGWLPQNNGPRPRWRCVCKEFTGEYPLRNNACGTWKGQCWGEGKSNCRVPGRPQLTVWWTLDLDCWKCPKLRASGAFYYSSDGAGCHQEGRVVSSWGQCPETDLLVICQPLTHSAAGQRSTSVLEEEGSDANCSISSSTLSTISIHLLHRSFGSSSTRILFGLFPWRNLARWKWRDELQTQVRIIAKDFPEPRESTQKFTEEFRIVPGTYNPRCQICTKWFLCL